MGTADPLLVGRRHVDLQRVRSAICCGDRWPPARESTGRVRRAAADQRL